MTRSAGMSSFFRLTWSKPVVQGILQLQSGRLNKKKKRSQICPFGSEQEADKETLKQHCHQPPPIYLLSKKKKRINK